MNSIDQHIINGEFEDISPCCIKGARNTIIYSQHQATKLCEVIKSLTHKTQQQNETKKNPKALLFWAKGANTVANTYKELKKAKQITENEVH